MCKKSARVNHIAIIHADVPPWSLFLPSKSSRVRFSYIFKKFLLKDFGKTPSSRQRFRFALYSPPSAVNITSYSEIANQSDCSNHQDH